MGDYMRDSAAHRRFPRAGREGKEVTDQLRMFVGISSNLAVSDNRPDMYMPPSYKLTSSTDAPS